MNNEIIFLVSDSPEGGYEALALGHSIYTEADTEADLRDMVRDAVSVHFVEDERPRVIRLHFVREDSAGRVRTPRDLDGSRLTQRLGKLGYEQTRQSGSHVRLTREWSARRGPHRPDDRRHGRRQLGGDPGARRRVGPPTGGVEAQGLVSAAGYR